MKNEVYKILAFFNLFKKALFKEEIEDFIGKKISQDYLKKNFSNKGKLWTIKGREENFEKTGQKLITSKKYLLFAKKYISFLRLMPYVRGLSICNTVSFFAADQKSDIDLFIIVKKGHIWTARFFITLMLQFLGVRRHGKKIAKRLCLSFFVDEENLDLSKIKLDFDPFLAFWTSAQVPIFGKKIFEKFAEKNRNWVKKEVGIDLRFEKDLENIPEPFSVFLEKVFDIRFEKFIKNRLLRRTEKKVIKLKNKDGTIIKDGILKFHDIDKRVQFAEMYQKISTL